jgi:hypothetical protein
VASLTGTVALRDFAAFEAMNADCELRVDSRSAILIASTKEELLSFRFSRKFAQ